MFIKSSNRLPKTMKKTTFLYRKLAGFALFITASGYALTTFNDTVVMNNSVVGSYASNSFTSNPGLIVGFNNVATNESAAVGYALTLDESQSMAVGKYNAYAGISTAFVVGNGTSSVRSNSFHVAKDGTVTIKKIPPQGGISMGTFQ
jgi:hypothetical protein